MFSKLDKLFIFNKITGQDNKVIIQDNKTFNMFCFITLSFFGLNLELAPTLARLSIKKLF